MSLPRYPEYKKTGSTWLGEVPRHWEVQPCRAFVVEQTQKNEGAANQNYLSLMANVGIIPYEEKGDVGNKKPEDLGKCKLVSKGDLVINSMNYGIGSYGLSELSGVCSSVYIVLRPRLDCVKARFAFRIFENRDFQKYAQSFGNGILEHRSAINWDMLKSIPVGLPPVEEQEAILTFLDQETAKIDALISEQEKLITLLAEKRQATISHAVTKGLNPQAPTKDSGVEWLGEVPEHWAVLTFQRCVYVAEGQVNPEDELYRSMILIAPNHVESRTGRLIALETAEEQSAESGKYLCEAGDVIYSKIRPALRKVCIAPEVCLCSADMYPLRGNSELTNEFLFWFILSEQFSAWAVLESDRVAMPKINRESLKSVWLACPPVDEQESISDFLANETVRFDNLAHEAGRGIALLKERRSALISAAVTGKIDVRQAIQQEQITIQDAA